MIFWAVIFGLAAGILLLLIDIVHRARRGKEEKVREYYAFKCVTLLIALAGDTVAAIMAPYSFWDFIAELFGMETAEVPVVAIISRILAVVVFLICCWAVGNTYLQWKGPVSRRQYRQDTQGLEENSMVKDFFLVAAQSFRENYDLLEYKALKEPVEYQENHITNELAWHIEFARMYMLISNQAHIDMKNDWHAEQHCFISSYADNLNIAIYCRNSFPAREEVLSFLNYIYRFHNDYFRVIVAVKEGSKEDYADEIESRHVEYRFKCNALDHLADFSEYYRAIETLYRQPLMESQFRMEDIYVEPYCKLEGSGSAFRLHGYVEEWLQNTEMRQLALLGDFGQGKTMFSIWLTYQMIQKKDGRIPILIPLRNKSPRNSNEAEIFSYFATQYGISVEALMLLNANGRLLLIFDGFDEMDLVGNDDIRKLHFKSLWSLVTPKSKVLITGRPNYFLSSEEMKAALGLQPVTKQLPYCEGLFLQPFDQEQIVLALRGAKESVRDGIQNVIENKMSDSFLDLISRPSHLFFVSLIWEARELEKKYQNLSSAVIINEFLQNCFERQTGKGQKGVYFYLSPAEREYFMIGVAARMYKMGAAAITQESFKDTIVDLIYIFPDQLSSGNPVFLNLRNGKSVRDFAREDVNSMLAIINDVRTCGILVNDYVNNGLTFAHKSFFDLLVAKFFMGKSMRLHDANMMISDTLSAVNAYNPRLRGDFVIRKLLAELICAGLSHNLAGTDERLKCRKIFEQCDKAITGSFLKTTPQKLLRVCLRQRGVGAHISHERWKRRKETGRFLSVMLFFFSLILAYLIRTASFSVQMRKEAVIYYGKVSVSESRIDSPEFLTGLFLKMALPMTVAAVVLVLIYTVVFYFEEGSQDRADMVLLTWYYACVEHHISEEVICRQFSDSYAAAFLDYIKGKNLNEIQNKMSRGRRKKEESYAI